MEDFFKEKLFKQRTEKSKYPGKSIPGSGKSEGKGSEVANRLVYRRNKKETCTAVEL